MFRRRSSLSVLAALTQKAVRDVVKALGEVPNRLSDRETQTLVAALLADRASSRTMDGLRSIVKDLGHQVDWVPDTVMDYVRRGLIHMGVRVRCSTCSLEDFQSMSEVTAGAVCAGCSSEEASFVRDSAQAPAVYFKLSSLTQRLSLIGGLTPLAATVLLQNERAYVVPGANIYRDGNRVGEVDLLGWVGQSLFAGEAKMSAHGFDVSDIDEDVRKTALIGADMHLAVCAEPISRAARDRLAAAEEEHRIRVRVIDNEDLFTDG